MSRSLLAAALLRIAGAGPTIATAAALPAEARAQIALADARDAYRTAVNLQTNQFDLFGVFNYTNRFSFTEPERFFRLRLQ